MSKPPHHYKVLHESDSHFLVGDGGGKPMKIAKHGLSKQTIAKIQAFAKGGIVKPRPADEGGDNPDVNGAPMYSPPDPKRPAPSQLDKAQRFQRGKQHHEDLRVEEDYKGGVVGMAKGGLTPEEAATLDDIPLPGADEQTASDYRGNIGTAAKNFVGRAFSGESPIDVLTETVQDPAARAAVSATPGMAATGFRKMAEMVAPGTTARAKGALDQRKTGLAAEEAKRDAAPPMAESPFARPGRSGASVAPASRLADAPEAQPSYIDAEVEQGAELARKRADIAGQEAEAQAATAARVQAMHAEYDRAYTHQMQQMAQAVDEYSRAEIDPGRWWASRSTEGKVLGAIGLALGAFSPDGINHAAGIINDAVAQDIEVQKAQHEMKLKGISERRNLLGIMREKFGDGLSAESASAMAMHQRALALIDEAAMKLQANPQNVAALKAKMNEAHALELRKADADAKLKAAQAAEANAKAFNAMQKGKGGGSSAANTALDNFEQAWKQGGGWLGALTKHIPGAKAQDVEAQRAALAATLAGEKKGARFQAMLQMLPAAGDQGGLGLKKIQAARAYLQGGASGGGGGAEDEESPE